MLLLVDFVEVPETTLIEGIVISIVGYAIVFMALVLLYYFFDLLSKVPNMQIKNRLRRQGKLDQIKSDNQLSVPGEVTAAIGMALYLATAVHDEESNIITIKKVSKTYSPWSSKIYGMRNYTR
jgi:Na+-transporting methylmalonyl-CoA/oxaloacetate decarboxylase gamma subunit